MLENELLNRRKQKEAKLTGNNKINKQDQEYARFKIEVQRAMEEE